MWIWWKSRSLHFIRPCVVAAHSETADEKRPPYVQLQNKWYSFIYHSSVPSVGRLVGVYIVYEHLCTRTPQPCTHARAPQSIALATHRGQYNRSPNQTEPTTRNLLYIALFSHIAIPTFIMWSLLHRGYLLFLVVRSWYSSSSSSAWSSTVIALLHSLL